MNFKTVIEVQEYLYTFRTKVLKEDLERKFQFAQIFAEELGNPQNNRKVIHAAGTSGKGSTCAIISHILTNHGFKTGLSISPHLYDLRERLQINGRILDEKIFCGYFNKIYPIIEKLKNHKFGPPSFFEIMIVFAYYVFQKEGVDYAVMETGQGGRLDTTNIANNKNKIAVMTKIGLDHIDILGDTLKKISIEKSAIIHPGNIVISIQQRKVAQQIVSDYASKMKSKFGTISRGTNYLNIKTSHQTIQFDFAYKKCTFEKLILSLSGLYQVENASMAIAAVYEASKRDSFKMKENIVRSSLSSIKTLGRFEELFVEQKRIIIDGAHNPQKMSAFIKSLKKKHPNMMFDFLIGFKKGKDYKEMLKYIVPIAHRIFVSEFEKDDQIDDVYPEKGRDVKKILAEEYGFTSVTIIPNSEVAFNKARKAINGHLVVTGSLYLISDLYKRIRSMINEMQKYETGTILPIAKNTKKPTYQEIRDFLYSFRSKNNFYSLGSPGFNFSRVMRLAELLGNPQNKIPVIHIAGTSGKGSTCGMISHLLGSHGLKVGLSISPHLLDLRERIQINNSMISVELFGKYIQEIIPAIQQIDEAKYGKLTFFEVMIVAAYYIFWKEGVDYAVMETGLGGLYDATNIATSPNNIAVITKLGLDHTDILGKTIAKIAAQKAGIIHPKNIVISTRQSSSATSVIREIAQKNQTKALFVESSIHYKHINQQDEQTSFDFENGKCKYKNLILSLQAKYQVENASLALVVVQKTFIRDEITLQEKVVREVFMNIKTPGRFQEMTIRGKKIIIDGAHNPQKMSKFIQSLKKRYSDSTFDFLIGFKKGKDYKEMLKYIVPLSQSIFISEFQGDDQAMMIVPESRKKIRQTIESEYTFDQISDFADPILAIKKAIKNHDTIFVITGSLYMISAILKKIKNI